MNNKPEIEPALFRILRERFSTHLRQEGNWRTIFSGKFGSGKTTFLDLFFEEEKEAFIPITLHPVNYSIATNEDIFEYIKYDLLLELLPKINLSRLDSIDFELPEKAYLYWHDHPLDLVEKTASLLGSLGKLLHPSIEALEKIAAIVVELQKKMEAHYQERQKTGDEHRILVEFLARIKEKSASLYEDTVLIRLIEKIVGQMKWPKSDDGELKKVILIIEDLDRIDPEHIFRILNVFSAHFDSKHASGENSFGIDVLVAICDEENIRNIFANRYGGNVDYSGYIDKFFTTSIFHFNYSDLAHNYIGKAISNLKLSDPGGRRAADSVYNTICTDTFLFLILALLFDHKHVNLRSINRVLNSPIPYASKNLVISGYDVSVANYLIVLELLILAEICGGAATAERWMEQMSTLTNFYNKRGKVFERLLALLIATEGTQVSDSGHRIKLADITYQGNIVNDDCHQKYLDKLVLTGSFGSANIDMIRASHLLDLVKRALTLISRNPHLNLYGYTHE